MRPSRLAGLLLPGQRQSESQGEAVHGAEGQDQLSPYDARASRTYRLKWVVPIGLQDEVELSRYRESQLTARAMCRVTAYKVAKTSVWNGEREGCKEKQPTLRILERIQGLSDLLPITAGERGGFSSGRLDSDHTDTYVSLLCNTD